MLDFSVTLLFTIVNLTFLFLVLRAILFKPVTKFMESRSEGIRRDIDSAKASKLRAEEYEAELKEHVKRAQDDGLEIIKASRLKAEQEAAAIVAEAREKAAGILESGRRELAEEYRSSLAALRSETAALTILTASRVIGESLDDETNRRLAERFLANMVSER